MAKSIEEKIAKIEAKKAAQKAKADAQLKKLYSQARTKERKERTRRLIELGGIVKKAGIEGWDKAELLGMLLQQKEYAQNNPEAKKRWSEAGKAEFEKFATA